MMKRAISIFRNRIWYPFYASTIGAVKKRSTVKEKYGIRKGIRNVVIFGTPNHGNLGDYAIYAAEKKLLSRYFPKHLVFGVNMTDFQHEIKALHSLLYEDDLLVLTGGGNLGNEYMDDENIRRIVIETFPRNRIVMFPQTMFFTGDEAGEREKERTAAIYNAHKRLWIAARDEQSYRDMQNLFTGKVRLLPDVVLTWGKLPATERKGALLVLRKDLEGVLKQDKKDELKELLIQRFSTVEETDTVIDVGSNLEALDEELEKKMTQFTGAELIVTDRLHGMIFAALAQTPCLVFGNYNHKVRETYKWISHLDYVEYLSEWNDLPVVLEKLAAKKNCVYEVTEANDRYAKFLEEIING